LIIYITLISPATISLEFTIGIPYEQQSSSSSSSQASKYGSKTVLDKEMEIRGEVTQIYSSSLIKLSTIEPRSDEFKEMLIKLSKSMKFLIQHHEIKDCYRYRQWLDKLENRTTSLIGKNLWI